MRRLADVVVHTRGNAVRVGFVDEADEAVPISDVVFVKTDADPG